MRERYEKLFSTLGNRGKVKFFSLIGLSILAAALQLVGVASIFPLMTLLSNPHAIEKDPIISTLYTGLSFQSSESFLLASGIAMVLAIFASNAFNILTIGFTNKFMSDEHVRLSDMLLQRYAYKPYVFFLQHDSTALCRDVLAEVGVFLGQFVKPLFDIAIRSLTILVIGGGLVLINPAAAFGSAVIFGGGYLVAYLLARNQLQRLGETRIQAEVKKFKVTWELFQGQREARLLNCRESFFSAYHSSSAKQQRAMLYTTLISQLPRQAIEVLGFALVFLLVLLFRSQGIPWDDILPLLSLYAVGAVRMMPQFQSLFASLAALQGVAPVVERLTPELNDYRPPSVDLKKLNWENKIEFKNLSYAYPGTDTKVLDGFTCTIPKGQHVGFVGSTGAGKTTLINIVLGLLIQTEGEFSIDGQPVHGNSLRRWQNEIGFVPQDIFLCNDTIAANIAFGVPKQKIDIRQVRKAAALASLSDHIDTLPEGYDTLVGERGLRLSGGQRQRLGIARALYRSPSVLILDEATSALDGGTEDAVMDAIRNVGGDKTLLIIAHRLTTLKECDTIFLLEDGKLEDSGTYDDLIKTNKTFRTFAKIE